MFYFTLLALVFARSVFEIKFSPRLLKALDIFSKNEVGLVVYFDFFCTRCD